MNPIALRLIDVIENRITTESTLYTKTQCINICFMGHQLEALIKIKKKVNPMVQLDIVYTNERGLIL